MSHLESVITYIYAVTIKRKKAAMLGHYSTQDMKISNLE